MKSAVSYSTSTQTFDLHNFGHLGALIHFPRFLTMALEKAKMQITASRTVSRAE